VLFGRRSGTTFVSEFIGSFPKFTVNKIVELYQVDIGINIWSFEPDYRFGGDCGCLGVEIFGICKSGIRPSVEHQKANKFVCFVGSMETLEKLKKD